MNKKLSTLLFAAALCGVRVSFAHETEATEAVTEVASTCCCQHVTPAQEVIETTEISLTEQELPKLTADEEQELEKLLNEYLKAQKEQEEALAAQEQE